VFQIEFPDYSEAELMQIFEKLCKAGKYRLSKPAKDLLSLKFSGVKKTKSQNFSNGRIVRRLFERVRLKQAMRASNNTITDADVEAAFSEKDIAGLFNSGNRAQIGFVNH